MRDKSLTEMAATLFRGTDRVILTTLDNPRAASIDELLAVIPSEVKQAEIAHSSSVAEALQLARAVTPPEGVICITGSLHLIGKAQELLKMTNLTHQD